MELTAQANKKRSNLFFATPVEYDHFGFQNPQANYQEAENRVFEINRNSTVIRSNLQDNNEAVAYFRSNNKNSFPFPLVSSTIFAQKVVETLANRTQGQKILVSDSQTQQQTVRIEANEYEHAKENLDALYSKINSINLNGEHA